MSRLTNPLWLASTFVAIALFATSSFAQDDRGGGRGDRGNRGGGPEGGGGFPSGGFRGGPPGGPGGFSPADMLRRFDQNGNGMIDPAESQGPAGSFLQRIAGLVPGLDLAKPVPIDKLSQAIDRLRQQRDSGDGDNNSGRGPSGDASTTIEPLVPGFGVEDLLTPAAGFGTEGELFTVKLTEADHREAEERFRRYDSNSDGILDKAELARGRWNDDPLTFDRNHDGKLTLSEMAVRYARRRIAEEESRAAQTASRSNDPRDSRGASGRGSFGGGFPGGGMPGGGEDPRSFFSRRDGGDGAASSGGGGSATASKAAVDPRKSYRVKTVTERLPKGLPDWFARSDADADGQVAMSEFATSWSDSSLKEYRQFDLNDDGIITPSEALNAVNNGAVRGSTSSPATATTASATAGSSTATSANIASATTGSRPATASSGGGEAPKLDPRYAAYYQKLLAKYDTNGDGALVADEWKGMSKDPSSADTDGDGRITVNELAAWSMKR